MTKEKQIQYDEFSENVPAERLDIYCSTLVLPIEEKIFKQIFKSKKVLDFGCGSGNRTFPFYHKNSIEFLGIEKSKNFASGSCFPDRIFQLDLFSASFKNDLYSIINEKNLLNFDTIALLGQVVSGFIEPSKRKKAWNNIASCIGAGKFIVLTAMAKRHKYEAERTGQIYLSHYNEASLPQYYYSRSEFIKLFAELELEIIFDTVEYLSDSDIGNAVFALRKR